MLATMTDTSASVSAAATMAGIPYTTLRDWVAKGWVSSWKDAAGADRVDVEEVKRVVAEQPPRSKPGRPSSKKEDQ